MRRQPKTALVLGGGNALGAYLAGACEYLDEQEVRPDWIIGASVGAVTGAILAGNAPEHRLAKLKQFWAEATHHTYGAVSRNETLRQTYNGVHSMLTLLFCRPNIFQRRYPGLWSALPWVPNDVAIFDHSPLRNTLERLVDFDRLNRAEVRFTIGCVDLESGDEVLFDNTREEIGPEHILASTAITPAFTPVKINGRLLCDPGYANNLPVDVPFNEPLEHDLLCIAIELFSLRSPQPASLDAVLERTQDIMFASPGRKSIKSLQREYGLREQLDPKGPQVKLVHLAYQAASHELATKTLDFSPSSVADRWTVGRRDMASGLDLLAHAGCATSRFSYLPVDAEEAAKAAQRGASRVIADRQVA
jgi:NTE family protein